MIKKLILDLDCTVLNTIKVICDLYNSDFCYYKNFKFVHWEKINTWDFTECDCASRDYINTYFNQPRFFQNVEFMDNFEDVVKELLFNGYEINVASHGYSPNLLAKRLWLAKNMPYVKEFYGVNLKEHDDKSNLDMSDCIFIDDRPSNLETSNAAVKICFGDVYEWNKDWTGVRCANWVEVLDYLSKLETTEQTWRETHDVQ